MCSHSPKRLASQLARERRDGLERHLSRQGHVTGETHAIFTVEPALLALLQDGRLKLLAATSKERTPNLAQLPTLAESGYPGVESIAWNGLFAPAGTPAAVVNQINAEVNETLREPTVRAALLKQGLVPGGGSAAEFQTLVEQEGRKWG